MNKLYFRFLVTLLTVTFTAQAQKRTTFSINSNWKFHKGNLSYPALLTQKIAWDEVQIPHSWNTADINDDIPGYYRGPGWYTKNVVIPKAWEDKEVYLLFEGANQTASIFVNGKKAGTHIGGYNGFNINISALLKFDGQAINEITVKVDNSYQPNIPPLTADFTFFGGLYRDVSLSAMAKVHFKIDQYGGRGVFITTPQVNDDQATVNVKGAITHAPKNAREVIVKAVIKDGANTIATQTQLLKTDGSSNFELTFKELKNPKLWSPASPHLYQVITTIHNAKTGEVLDELSNPLGFRWFKFDPIKGFYLNGKPLKLIGASRHQDYKDMANAVPDELAVHDVKLLKEMGGNFLRVAHYPQDKAVLAACDRLGILTAVEIPIVNAITENDTFANNSKTMQLEMIRQNFNHPSVIIWAYMNEVLLRPPFAKDSARQEIYFKNVAKLAQEIEDLTRKEDKYRYTMIPNHGNFALYHRVGLTKIPMLVGWNLYQGWYSGKFSGFAKFLDMHHQMLPNKPLLVTEYGADADHRIHSANPVRFDKSVEYAIDYHQYYLKAMLDRPFVAAIMAWNLADFSSEERGETDPHINNKGLLTIDREAKDSYYFYQANLLKQAFIKIGLSGRKLLEGVANEKDRFTQKIKVYSNQSTVSLIVNGQHLAEQKTTMGIANFEVDIKPGTNTLIATSGTSNNIQDQVTVMANLVPQQLNSTTLPFEKINISLGDTRYFFDEYTQQVWIPEQPYQTGSWGYIGGKVFKMADTSRLSFGSNKSISGTRADAIYQTQRVGLKEFKLDVPDGQYDLVVHFAELLSKEQQQALAYELATKSTSKENFKERLFDVELNGKIVIQNLGNSNYLQPSKAYSYTIPVTVSDKAGITLKFKALLGEPILNGIQVKRIY